MRGTCNAAPNSGPNLGLIPAGAGNMQRRPEFRSESRAHPRGCGEHKIEGLTKVEAWGSSPRVRGTFQGGLLRLANLGLIPAGAGNIKLLRWAVWNVGAHPRGCGEHDDEDAPVVPPLGSSPRVRGTWMAGRPRTGGHGLIPAGAGNILHQ